LPFFFQTSPCAKTTRAMMSVMQHKVKRLGRVPPGAPLCKRFPALFHLSGNLTRAWFCKDEPSSGCDPGSPLPSKTSAGGCLWVESHSDVFATGSWACEAVKTANCLRTYLPAVFAVQRSMPYCLSNAAEGEIHRDRPSRV
jgi:hypothetical protein